MNHIEFAAICIFEHNNNAQTFDDFIESIAIELLHYSEEESHLILDTLLPIMSEFIYTHFPI
jgi:hypothetical protein